MFRLSKAIFRLNIKQYIFILFSWKENFKRESQVFYGGWWGSGKRNAEKL
jgi:hypothetical protein